MSINYDNIIPDVQYFIERHPSIHWSIIGSVIDFYDLTYIYKGSATYMINDTAYIVKAGDLIYIPKGSYREAYIHSDDPIFSYAFNFQLYHIKDEPIDLPFPSIFHIDTPDYLLNLLNQFNSVWLEKGPGYQLKNRAIFMLILHHLLSLLYEEETLFSSDKRIEKVKAYILKNYQQNLTMNHLASLISMNPVYLGSLFKKATGYSIKEYITHIRIHKAHDLLSLGEYSVSEVAYQCGFEDLFYFSKVFKKKMGKSPSHLLKSNIIDK